MTIQDKIAALIAHYKSKEKVAAHIGVTRNTVHRWTKGVKPLSVIEPLIEKAYNQIKG